MDRFSEETAADLMRHRDRGLHLEPSDHEHEKCPYCDRRGGTPFLMTGDGEMHCSRCFEDFTPTEFLAWLQDSPAMVESAAPACTGRAIREDALYLGAKQPTSRHVWRAAA